MQYTWCTNTHQPAWREEFFACLHPDACVHGIDNAVSDWHRRLARHSLQGCTQAVVFHRPCLLPRREPARFAVVSVHSHVHFWPDEQDFSVVEQDSTVVPDAFVHHRHAHVHDDARMVLVGNELAQHLQSAHPQM